MVDDLHNTGAGAGWVRICANGATTVHEDEESMLLMPRVDKSEGQVELEPKEPEKVPSHCIRENEDGEDHRYFGVEGGDEVGCRRHRLQIGSFVRSCCVTGCVGMLTLIFGFVFGASVSRHCTENNSESMYVWVPVTMCRSA
jgi:hypothetical protein